MNEGEETMNEVGRGGGRKEKRNCIKLSGPAAGAARRPHASHPAADHLPSPTPSPPPSPLSVGAAFIEAVRRAGGRTDRQTDRNSLAPS